MSVPWNSIVITGILSKTLQSDFLCQPEPIQVTCQHHLEMYFLCPWYYRQGMVNVIQIKNIKPPKCIRPAGNCMYKVSVCVSSASSWTYFERSQFFVCLCALLQPCFLFTHSHLSFTLLYKADCFYSLFLILQSVAISALKTFLLLSKAFFFNKQTKNLSTSRIVHHTMYIYTLMLCGIKLFINMKILVPVQQKVCICSQNSFW